ncbi:MAG: hypothetical protein ABI140_19660 [Jatrophihabitantaceae bacterium]
MNRNHRLVLSLATTAGLFGGAWHSLGSIPVSRTVSSSQSGSTSVLVVPAAELSLSPLLANLDSGNDAVSRLQAQLSDLEAAIRRAERVRALMIARQAAATPGPPVVPSQYQPAPAPDYSTAPPAAPAPARSTISTPAARPSAAPSASRSSTPPAVHTSTGASGTSSSADGHGDDGGGDD